jgi:hypothetical protein
MIRRPASLLALALALAIALLAPAPAPAAAPSTGAYQVEVIIFKASETPAGEALDVPAEGRGFDGRIDQGATPPMVLRMLDASQLQLGTLASKMRANGGYRVLAHAGWVQTATDWPRHGGIPLDQLGITAPDLSGSLFLERGPSFLHFGVDLKLGTSPAWSLSELRKVKYNERNYFDHPGFGVIAIVSPAKRE